VTKEETKATMAALLEERRGYANRVLLAEEGGDEEQVKEAKARLAGVDAELRRLGGKAQKRVQTASTRPSARTKERRSK
jgi:hypothetical protein